MDDITNDDLERRRHIPLNESQIRGIVTEVFSEYIYRLDTRYVPRGEVEQIQRNQQDQDKAILVLEQRLTSMDEKLGSLGKIVERVGWSIVGTVLLAIVGQAISFALTH